MRRQIEMVDHRLRRLGLQIVVCDRTEAPPGVVRLQAAPEEFERFLDMVAPEGEDDLEGLGWALRADPVDVSEDGTRANWVVAIAIDVPVDALDDLVGRLGRHFDATGDRPLSILVEGPDTIQ